MLNPIIFWAKNCKGEIFLNKYLNMINLPYYMNQLSDVENFRILTLNTHLRIETELNMFISMYIFRSCKDSKAKSIDGCNIFQDLILDNLTFAKKKEIIFDSLLCNKRYRGTFDNVASIDIDINEHMRLARQIGKKVKKLNKLRNKIAHKHFLMDSQELFNLIKKENKEIKKGLSNMVKKNDNFINIKAEKINIEKWFKEINEFFQGIRFNSNGNISP